MNRRSSGIVLLLLVALTIALWLANNREAPAQPVPAVDAEHAADAATGDLVSTRPPDEQSLQRTSVADSTSLSWVVRGEVMHGSVAPLPGAHFKARLFSGWQAAGEPRIETELVSDADGAFAWPLPAPSATVTLTFTQCRDDTSIMASSQTLLASDPAPQAITVFAFLRDCTVSGSVTDEALRPIPGSWVVAGYRDAHTPCNEVGEFRLLTSATYGETEVTAGAPGYVLARQSVKVKGRDAKVTMHFRLQAARRVTGRVTNDAGAPVAAALVYSFAARAAATYTDADGQFEIPNIDPASSRHTLQVEHPDYLTLQRSITPEQLGEPCDFVLKRGVRLTGRIFGLDGRPIAGAEVHVGQWIGYLGQPLAVSRDDGTFTIDNLPTGRPQMSVFARGYAPDTRSIAVPSEAQEVAAPDVHLTPGHSLAGKVVDVDGNGLHRVRITPVTARRGPQQTQVGPDVYTDRDGNFGLRDLPAGEIDLDCFGMQVTRKEERGVKVDQTDVRITMQRPARLAGRVLDAATGQPLARFSIRFVEPELLAGEQRGGDYGVEWSRGLVFEGTDGVWNTDGERFADGAIFGVEASAAGYGPVVQRRVIAGPDADPDALVFRLPAAARITGRVVDARSGEAIAAAQVALFHDGRPLAGRDPFADASLAVRGDERGHFELVGVPAGAMSLVVRHPQWPLTFDGPFAVTAGATTERLVSLPAGATLTGTIVGLDGQALAGVKISREGVEIEGVRMPGAIDTSDAMGRFRFARLAAAHYWLHADARLPDGSTLVYSQSVDVAADQEQELRLAPAGSATLRVDFTADGALPEGMAVFMTRSGAGRNEKPFYCSLTGSTLVARGLPAGTFQVSISHHDAGKITSGSGSVSVSSGGTAQLGIKVFVSQH